MQLSPFIKKNKIIISGAVGALIFIGLGYWFIFIFLNSESEATTTSTAGTNLLPKNLVMISDVLSKEKLSLKDVSFIDSYYVKNAKDYTTVAPSSTKKGRFNPFAPYDFTGPSR